MAIRLGNKAFGNDASLEVTICQGAYQEHDWRGVFHPMPVRRLVIKDHDCAQCRRCDIMKCEGE